MFHVEKHDFLTEVNIFTANCLSYKFPLSLNSLCIFCCLKQFRHKSTIANTVQEKCHVFTKILTSRKFSNSFLCRYETGANSIKSPRCINPLFILSPAFSVSST